MIFSINLANINYYEIKFNGQLIGPPSMIENKKAIWLIGRQCSESGNLQCDFHSPT